MKVAVVYESLWGNTRTIAEEHTLVVILGRYSFQTQQRESAADTELVSGTLRSRLAALSGRPVRRPQRFGAARPFPESSSAAIAAVPARACASARLSPDASASRYLSAAATSMSDMAASA